MEEIKTKVCSKCGKEFPISEFYKNPNTGDGYATSCKSCYNKSGSDSRGAK